MGVRVIFDCGGCEATADGTARVTAHRFIPISRLWSRKQPRTADQAIQEIAPKGWIAFDPYTSCTYCPDCWASIEQPTHPEDGEA